MRYLPITLLLALAITAGCGDDETGEPPAAQPAAELAARKFVSVTETDSMSLPGQMVPAKAETVTLWLGPNVARRDVGTGSLLVHPERDRFTWLDHEARTWTSQTGAELRRQIAALAADTLGVGVDDPRLHQLRRMLNLAVRVTATADEGEIDGYRCRRWLVEQRMGDQTTLSELWLTRDIPVDWPLLQRLSQPTLAALPGGERALEELARLEGFPVRAFASLEVMGRPGRSVTSLLEVADVTVPAAHFLPPPDYGPSGPTTPAGDPSR